MFEIFKKLPEEKRDKIVRAAIEEFAKKGYKRGSTNNIVKNAEISKGLLFHYFGNKESLYLYIVDYALDQYTKLFNEYIEDTNSLDVFERIKELSLIKIKVFTNDPLMYEFITKSFLSIPEELEEKIQKRYIKIYSTGFSMLLENIDKGKFRKDIDVDKAIELLMISLDGITQKYIKVYKGREEEILKEIDVIMTEIDAYMDLLKWGFYRN